MVIAMKWCARYWNGRWYAVRGVWEGKRTRQIRMHKTILGVPLGKEVDHRNGDGLDNRRDNLRPATHSQNIANSKMPSTNTTGVKGVCRNGRKWHALIRVNGHQIRLGSYHDIENAASAYRFAAEHFFGEFARQ